jgi:hypothetical protein
VWGTVFGRLLEPCQRHPAPRRLHHRPPYARAQWAVPSPPARVGHEWGL